MWSIRSLGSGTSDLPSSVTPNLSWKKVVSKMIMTRMMVDSVRYKP